MINIIGIVLFCILPALVLLWLSCCVYLEYRRDRIPILLYHRLISKSDAEQGLVPDNEMIYVSYDTVFAEQMAFLAKAGYTTLDLDDYVKIRSGQAPMPEKPVIITFDDGYLSNYTMAYPALQKHNHKATIFVAPEPDEYTRKLVKGIDDFANEDQMREMADNKISIQSHTMTHCILTNMDDKTAFYELSESRKKLSNITNHPVDHLAVPRAGYSRRIKKLVKKAGYKTACCNNKGSANGLSDPLALPRIVIERNTRIEDFARSLQPRTSAILRIVGNIKRIPERIGGPIFAKRIRDILYIGPLRIIFETRNLKKLIILFALLYLIGSLAFMWYLIEH